LSASVALCWKTLGVEMAGFLSGTRMDDAVLLKRPVFRQLPINPPVGFDAGEQRAT